MTSSGQVVYGTDPDGVTLKIVDKAGKARFMKADHTPKSGVWSLSLTPASDLGLGEYYRITAGGVVKEGALLENVGWVPFEEFDSSDPRVVASGGPGAGGGSGAYVASTGDETIAGVKTFSSSPIIPAPTTDLQAATKKYVDDNAGGGGATSSWTTGTAVSPVSPFTTQGNAAYIVPDNIIGGAFSQALLANRYYFVPAYLRQDARLADLSCHVLTAQPSAVARLGVYDANADGLPGNLLVDAGTVDCSTTGTKQVSVNLDVSAGWVWFVFVVNDGSVAMRVWTLASMSAKNTLGAPAIGTSLINEFSVSVDTSALLDPAPATQWYNSDDGGIVDASVVAQP